MSLLLGYSSGSDSDSDREENGNTENAVNTFAGTVESTSVDHFGFKGAKPRSRARKAEAKQLKRRRLKAGDPSAFDGDDSFKGPWAGYSDSEEDLSDHGVELTVELPPEKKEAEDDEEDDEEDEEEEATDDEFNGPRNILELPDGVEVHDVSTCYAPKRLHKTYSGHVGGVQVVQFLPETGHLLLSCGNDRAIKIWDVYRNHEQLRGYFGHTAAVKFAEFNSDGTRIISCAYDRTVRIWDTETGRCLHRRQLDTLPNIVRFNRQYEEEYLVGLSNRFVEHYSLQSAEPVERYAQNAGTSCLEFAGTDDAHFVTSCEDKSLRVWDVRGNVPLKIIAEPSQNAMPFLRSHPGGNYFVAQSMNDTIVTYSAKKSDKFKAIHKKTFTGHQNVGHRIGLQFTPDGRTLVSGDSQGAAYFWDWKSAKLVRRLQVGKKNEIVTCVDTHPWETSTVALAGTSGRIFVYK